MTEKKLKAFTINFINQKVEINELMIAIKD
jgi:hypothetical protein